MNLPEHILRAGPLSMRYENGFLRYLRVGDVEVLRMVYFAVRNQNWDTIEGRIRDEEIRSGSDSFEISYTWESSDPACAFVWKCRITGQNDGRIDFEIDGEALAPFRKNRVGFCVLHPVKECAGQPCEITTSDGEGKQGQFPQLISPHQPFMNIRAMRWQPGGAGEAEIEFEGDVFETEDQRNWTDDSYKTYCTPLGLPFPVQLQAGDKVRQAVRFSWQGNAVAGGETEKQALHLALDREIPYKRPAIGIGQSSEYAKLTAGETAAIRNIGFDHYRVEIRLGEESWREKLENALTESALLGLPLAFVLFFGKQATDAAEAFARICQEKQARMASVLLLHESHKTTPAALLEAILPVLRAALPGVPLGAGTNAYFTELNRVRVAPQGLDFLSYSVNPQVHAFDNDSLTETLDAQAYTVESARVFADGCAVHLSPITLKPRFNPNATAPEPPPAPGNLPETVDPRQLSCYAAAWTLGSISSLTRAGADALTYFETLGMRGILQGEREPAIPQKFPTKKGMLYPVWQVFRELMRHRDSAWIPLQSSDSLAVKGMLFQQQTRATVLFANYRNEAIDLHLRLPAQELSLGLLDETTVADALEKADFWEQLPVKNYTAEQGIFSIQLKPHALARGTMRL